MKNCNIAILGATGAVGREMLNVLEEYDIPVSRLKLLSSARSAGSKIPFRGEDLTVEEATDASFEGMDFVLGAVKSGMSRAFAPAIVKSGAVYIDNSSAFRMDPAIPLVVPEINGEDAKSNSGIIANPNCSTIITAMAVGALNRLSPIESMVACTYQAVSGAGQGGLEELECQMDALARGEKCEAKVFPTQIALNVIPFIGSMLDNLYTDEEMKIRSTRTQILSPRSPTRSGTSRSFRSRNSRPPRSIRTRWKSWASRCRRTSAALKRRFPAPTAPAIR